MVETDDFETLQEAYRLWNDSKADSVTHWTNRMRNGKIVEFFEFYDTAQAIAAAR